jgi:hypothetical protein
VRGEHRVGYRPINMIIGKTVRAPDGTEWKVYSTTKPHCGTCPDNKVILVRGEARKEIPMAELRQKWELVL